MEFNLLEKVETILLHSNQSLTAKEIASKIIVKYSEDCDKKYRNSKNSKKLEKDKEIFLVEQIQAEIPKDKDLLNKHNITITDERPCRYFYKKDINIDIQNIDNKNIEIAQSKVIEIEEKDLYPNFIRTLYRNNIYGMRIDEKLSGSSKKGANKWLHPDIVAVRYLGENWEDEIKDFSYFFNKQTLKLYSYEIKLKLNIGSVREAYFQAVSNSSWAT